MKPFDHVIPTDEQHLKMQIISDAFAATQEVLEAMPPSRRRSLAMTALEESCMWAKKDVLFTEAPPVGG